MLLFLWVIFACTCARGGMGMGLGWGDVNVHMKLHTDLMPRFGRGGDGVGVW